MRLICGLMRLDGTAASENLLLRMAAQMDAPQLRPSLRIWRDGPVGLGLLDFSAGVTGVPPLPQLGASTITADVRLDEPDKLRDTFGVEQSEDALLLAVLERYGPTGLDQVLGDFTFANWNSQTQTLVCARDAFGIRPFSYVYKPAKFFAFASLANALHGSGIVPKTIDQDAVARRVVHAYRFDDSLVLGIKRLPPAHFIEVSRENISLQRYWQLDRSMLGTNKCSATDVARELRSLVDRAVRCRLPLTGETGAHLSGGLDSSAIAVLAARQLREAGSTLHAYSFLDRQRNDITTEDEAEFVKAVLDQEGDIDWTPIRPAAGLPGLGETLDIDKLAPLGEEQPENQVCQRAKDQGVELILSGWGGDESATYNGRGALAELFLHGRWRKLAHEMSSLRRERGWSLSRVFYSEVLSYFVPGEAKSLAKRLSGKGQNMQSLIVRSLSHELNALLAKTRDGGLSMVPDGRENRWRLITSPHIAERAEVWAQIGARHGLAFAFPLLDRRVVEFSLSLPSDMFLNNGFRRRPFREAMIDVLPALVRLRHQKYLPFPSRMLDIVEGKDAYLESVVVYERNERVRTLIDLAHLRRQVQSFPSPEDVRDELRGNDRLKDGALMLAALQTLVAAEYLTQHDQTECETCANVEQEDEVD